jgi:hypothetical protein
MNRRLTTSHYLAAGCDVPGARGCLAPHNDPFDLDSFMAVPASGHGRPYYKIDYPVHEPLNIEIETREPLLKGLDGPVVEPHHRERGRNTDAAALQKRQRLQGNFIVGAYPRGCVAKPKSLFKERLENRFRQTEAGAVDNGNCNLLKEIGIDIEL